MKGSTYLLVAVVALGGVVVYSAHSSGRSDGEADPVFGITIPPGYRDWKLISVAHEEGNLRRWGFGHFGTDGKPGDAAFMKSCFPCHEKAAATDLVFTRYAP